MSEQPAAPKRRPLPKSEWGDGPWQNEPDRLEWRHHGVPCLAVRSESTGSWCGYAAVEPGHPWHGVGIDDPDVHGGITYAGHCNAKICHVPAPGEPDDVWWLGFDCAHAGDDMPAMRALLRQIDALDQSLSFVGDTYRDLAYVRAECERLADQLIAARRA